FGGYEKFQTDANFRDYIPFHEYFHGDNGRGCGASCQTGWTGLLANLIDQLLAAGEMGEARGAHTACAAARRASDPTATPKAELPSAHRTPLPFANFGRRAQGQQPKGLTMSLNNKVAVVTGGNSGIGKAIVLELARQGARIVIDYVVHPETTEALEQQIVKLGDQ